MQHVVGMLLAAIGVSWGSGCPASAQAAPVHTEKIEWTWTDRSDTIDPRLPNVLLVGDSITRAYFPEVARRFAGKANVDLMLLRRPKTYSTAALVL